MRYSSMLTITDAAHKFRLPIAGILFALAAWFGGMAVLALAVDPPAVIAFGPERGLFAAVETADTALLSVGTGFVTARADRPGTVRRLYAGGAWFVWPVLKAGCFPEKAPSRRQAAPVRSASRRPPA